MACITYHKKKGLNDITDSLWKLQKRSKASIYIKEGRRYSGGLVMVMTTIISKYCKYCKIVIYYFKCMENKLNHESLISISSSNDLDFTKRTLTFDHNSPAI